MKNVVSVSCKVHQIAPKDIGGRGQTFVVRCQSWVDLVPMVVVVKYSTMKLAVQKFGTARLDNCSQRSRLPFLHTCLMQIDAVIVAPNAV